MSVSVGGSKGHIAEEVTDPVFVALYRKYRWRMIPNCTGRYTCKDHSKVCHLSPKELMETVGVGSSRQYKVVLDKERNKDEFIAIPFDNEREVGLISYIKDGSDVQRRYVHTLNAPSGFQRKLDAMGVSLSDKMLTIS